MENLKIIKKAKYTDKSDEHIKRLFIEFPNGNNISIIRGNTSYGGKEGFFEIMPTDKTGNLKNTHLDVFEHDSVVGWLTESQVNEYIKCLSD